MRIRYLTLANFRGLKDKSFDLSGDNVSIYGSNGTGKTTTANAISYLMTDAPSTGEKDFSPKTEGAHNLNHTAEMEVVDNNGEIHKYKKDFHEVWKKKRGSRTEEFSGHEVSYAIDGVPAKKRDYDAAMEALCGGDAKRALMLSKVGYFAEEMPWQERRKILFDVCGDVSDAEIIEKAGLEELKDVLKMPGGGTYAPEDYMQIAKAQRRDLNKKLDELPSRIDELARTLPEGEAAGADWLTDTEAAIKKLEQTKTDALAAASVDTHISACQAAVAGLKTQIETNRAAHLAEQNRHVNEWAKRTGAIREVLHGMEDNLRKLHDEKAETESQLARMKQKREELLAQFEELRNRRWDPAAEMCPTCGQALPKDAVEELRRNFLAGLAKEKARINEEGQAVSTEAISKVESSVAEFANHIKSTEEDIASEKQRLEDSQAEAAKITRYEDTPKYQEDAARLAELEEKLRNAKEEHMPADTSEVDAKIAELREAVARYKAAESARTRIAELTEEQKRTGATLDKVDKGIALCEQFFREKMHQVSKRVDDHFENIGFLLFEEQINGGLKEICEPLVPDSNGNMVKYKSANTAARVNAGLEIIDVLSRHYGVYLPVIVDRAESVTQLRPMPNHQVIRLIVSEQDKDLRVEKTV